MADWRWREATKSSVHCWIWGSWQDNSCPRAVLQTWNGVRVPGICAVIPEA
uniref:Uncharacterized protein n=1 Tax=Arundo donax TaxID=35708 RepID=A0A0A8ZFJ7_ARUDO